MTNAWQLAILCQFNESDSHSYRDIQAGTKIAENILTPQLNLLVKAKVLLQEGTNYDLNLSMLSRSCGRGEAHGQISSRRSLE